MNYDKLFSIISIPDFIIRIFIRFFNKYRLLLENKKYNNFQNEYLIEFIEKLNLGEKLAIETKKANEQHYELPTEFYQKVLGKNLKYSSCLFDKKTKNLSQAEENMLELYIQRGDLRNGQTILELGCGWGSLSLFLAKKFPKSKIIGISNSKTQKIFIDSEIKRFQLKNLKIITQDINDFKINKQFDRIVSIEMFEHIRNYKLLFQKLYKFLKNEGKLFIHIFSHIKYSYLFEEEGNSNWMGKYFFSGGIMPSHYLFLYFSTQFVCKGHWVVNGINYSKTSEEWLKNFDNNIDEIKIIFQKLYGEKNIKLWLNYWRIFFMAVSELFKTSSGREWIVSHYLFEKN